MASYRDNSTLGTILGIIICGIAIFGTTFLGWTWENPEGKLLPLLFGVGAATVAVFVAYRKLTT